MGQIHSQQILLRTLLQTQQKAQNEQILQIKNLSEVTLAHEIYTIMFNSLK